MTTVWRRVLIVAALIGGQALSAQELTATLDRSTIFEGETVLLKIEQLNPKTDTAPDFSQLGSDFRVLDSGTNSSLEVANGRRRLVVEHNVLLEPRRAGEIAVPAIRVGDQQTRPLTLSVMARPDGSRTPDQDIYIEAEAEPLNPYVHGQIRLTVRLFHSPPITEGSLTPDAWPEGLVVERIGEDQTYQTRIGDARYRVIERRYALFPERSGPLELPEVRFRGRVADPNQGRTSLFSRGRRVSVESRPIQLDVRSQPSSYAGANWLPAASLEVVEIWPDGEPRFVQGEPVTRTLVVKAKGLLAAQLPNLEFEQVDGIKVYPDQATTRTHADGGWAVAQREQKYALVPTQTGAMTLPEIRVPWWDTQADEMRTFVVPAREISVLPGSAALATPPEPLISATVAETSNAPVGSIGSGSSPWRELAWLFALLWLLTTWLWWRSRPTKPVSTDESAVPKSNWRRQLNAACDSNDPRAAATSAIGLIADVSGHPLHSLAAAARQVTDPRLGAALLELDRRLYRGDYGGGTADDWNGAELKSLLARPAVRRNEVRSGRDTDQPLPPLYPA